jgi:hypothetical protein
MAVSCGGFATMTGGREVGVTSKKAGVLVVPPDEWLTITE